MPDPAAAGGVTTRDFVDPAATREAIYGKTLGAVSAFKPLENKKFRLSLGGVDWADPPDFSRHDVKRATLEGRTLSRRLRGTWTLADIATGAPVATKKTTLAEVPYYTNDGTFVLNGSHWSLASQSRLRAGVYTRRKENGELDSHINVLPGTGMSHRLGYDPESGLFHARFGGSTVPLASVMKSLGVPDSRLREAWGPVAPANIAKADAASIAKLSARISSDQDPDVSHSQRVANALRSYPLDPEVTARTLGKPYDRVDADVYIDASKKLMALAKGEVPPDDRDHLAFMTVHGPEDLLSERVDKDTQPVRRALWKSTLKGNLSGMPPGVFTGPMLAAIQSSGLGQSLEEINPLGGLEQRGRLSRMGTGGLPSIDSIPSESRAVQPSYLNFVDPIVTPENTRAGVDSRVASNVRKGDDGRMYSRFLDARTGAEKYLHPGEVADKTVAFPGWRRNMDPHVPAMKGGRTVYVPRHQLDYELPAMEHAFGPISNLVPMKSAIKQQRLAMGARMTTQALPLVGAEAPHVRTGVPGSDDDSYEAQYGVHAGAIRADNHGTVMEVRPDGIRVRHDDGTEKVHELEPFAPSNRKTYLSQTPTVQAFQRVAPGHLLAKSNYTDDQGTIALGRNIRVGMLPGFGRHSNFEDAWVASESLAAKMRSQHAYQHDVDDEEGKTRGKSSYVSAFPAKYAKATIDNFTDDGLIRPGTVVKSGDPLVLALRRKEPSRDRVYRGHTPTFTDSAETWDHDHDGVVTDVVRTKEGVKVVVRTESPMQLADKLCYDAETEILTTRGWKLVSAVTLEDRVCCLQGEEIIYRHPTAIHAYPRGGRMYRIKSQQVDFLVTAQHQMYVKRDRRPNFELLPAESIFGKLVHYKKSGAWSGYSPKQVRLRERIGAAGQGGKGLKVRGGEMLDTVTFLSLLGAFLSEGSCFNTKKGAGLDIHQSIPAGRAKFETELIPRLKAVGIHCTVRPDRYRINSRSLYEYFKRFGKSKTKYIPSRFFDYDRPHLAILFEWLMWGDGHTKQLSTKPLPICYSTISPRLADDVQRLCLHIGKAANIKKIPAPPYPMPIKGKLYMLQDKYDVRIINTKLTPAVNHTHAKTQKIQEEYFLEDYVEPVYCVTVPEHIVYVRRNGKPAWSGNSGRHGNKGVVGSIAPDDEMPHGADGKPLELLYSPYGTITRSNPAAAVEMWLGKIAAKTGKSYNVQDFEKIDDLTAYAQQELKKHGMEATETVTDPRTGRKIPGVTVGNMFMMKLHHTAFGKAQARGTGGYTADGMPARGGYGGSKRLALMSTNAILSHGATDVLKDALHVRGSANPDYWLQYMSGHAPQGVQVPFVHRKFFNQLKAAGLNVTREGARLNIMALTPKDIDELAGARSIRNAETVDWKEGQKPVPGGLFDESLFGGRGSESRWAAIDLAEPMPSPAMEEPIRRILKLTEGQYRDVLAGRHKLGEATGPEAIRDALHRIDLPKAIAHARADVVSGKKTARDESVRRLGFLLGADKNGIHPRDWVWNRAPVLPPAFRPVSVMQATGRPMVSDANILYNELFAADKNLRDMKPRVDDVGEERLAVYDALKAVAGLGDSIQPRSRERGIRGAMAEVVGASPKFGTVQQKLLASTVDLVGRGVIVPDHDLDLDSVGIPEAHAWEVYKPFVVRRLVRRGLPRARAALEVTDRTDIARKALQEELGERPVKLDRAPVLHRYGVMAFWPKLTSGDAIRLNPLVTSGFGADYDGDTMNWQVPAGDEAVKDAIAKLLPSKNLFSTSDFRAHQLPLREYAAGLYLSTRKGDPNRVPAHFRTEEDAIAAYHRGDIRADQPVHIAGT